MIPWWSTDFGAPEIARVTAAITGKHISQGKITREFEEALAARLGVPYVVCTTSGTTALTIALLAAGLGAGDAVTLPNRTWIATAHAVMLTGAQVLLADVDKRGLLPPEAVRGFSIPVHLNGRMSRAVDVIEDSCQAFPQPPRGAMACYSLSTAKIIATGQGGFVATRDEGCYRELKALRTHDVEDAMVPAVLQWKRFGYNFRFTDIQAAVGLAQLERLEGRIQRLREIYKRYSECLPVGLQLLHVEPSEIPLYVEILHPRSEEIRAHLKAHEIEARPFYPSLDSAPYLHKHAPRYERKPAGGYIKVVDEFPNSRKFEKGLILPSGPCQSEAAIEYTCDVLCTFDKTPGYRPYD